MLNNLTDLQAVCAMEHEYIMNICALDGWILCKLIDPFLVLSTMFCQHEIITAELCLLHKLVAFTE